MLFNVAFGTIINSACLLALYCKDGFKNAYLKLRLLLPQNFWTNFIQFHLKQTLLLIETMQRILKF